MEKQEIIELLKEKNMKITNNRVSIISCLSDDKNFHTVGEIQEHVSDLNTKSIYNNLKALIENDIVKTYSFHGVSKYTVADKYKDHENSIHIVNKSNVEHIDIDDHIFDTIKKKVKEKGYDPESINIFVDIK